MQNTTRITAVKQEYLSQVATLAQTYELGDLSPVTAGETGFLVSAFSEKDYQKFMQYDDHFYVSLAGETVAGFLLAYTSDKIQPNEWLNMLIKSRHPDPFILIKQICVNRNFTGRGIATSLYQHLFHEVPRYPHFAAIVRDPPNLRSIAFHKKLGFYPFFEATPPDGIRREVWKREPLE